MIRQVVPLSKCYIIQKQTQILRIINYLAPILRIENSTPTLVDYRSNVGIYLGKVPKYRHNVSLILILTTGLVSLQFHITYNPTCEVIKVQINMAAISWISNS